MKTTILIATHKPYTMPLDPLYMPIHVGAKGKSDIVMPINPSENDKSWDGRLCSFTRDDSGDNISEKNPYYSELTGLYWAWKNLDGDIIGLSHYRRRFSNKSLKSALKDAKEESEFVIVPNKRKYYIESLYTHYGHTLDASHLDMARDIIAADYPDYVDDVKTVYDRSWGYMWNMFVMPKHILDEYCGWLFNILFKMEERIDLAGMSAFDARLFGRVSEILFNVWLENLLRKSKYDFGIVLIEIPVYSTEKVPWGKKISAFLAAKFFGKKYKESF